MTGNIVWHLHHIIPKHMGGTDEPENLIRVNVACHAFLHKCLWEEYGLLQDKMAWLGLSNQLPYRFIDEELENIRRTKISEANKGTIFSEETKRNMSTSAKKRANSKSGKEHLQSIAHLGSKNRVGFFHTEEAKQKISEKNKGNKLPGNGKYARSDEQKRKQSEAMKEYHRRKKNAIK